jgi:hypothetical protein
MARQRVAPDKNLPMSQASRKSDEEKILSGVSQSQRGDKLIEIVQYLVGQDRLDKLPVTAEKGLGIQLRALIPV